MADRPALRIELLGGFRVVTEGHVPCRLPSTRQQQLIAFLVLHARNTAIARQRVAGSLWPESSDTQALTNLRRELHHLKDSRTLAWSDAGAGVDVVAFEADAERGLAGDRGALHRAARLYTGDILRPDSGDHVHPNDLGVSRRGICGGFRHSPHVRAYKAKGPVSRAFSGASRF